MDAIITLDASQRIVVFNRAAAKMFGVPAAEAIGQGIDRFLPQRYRERHRALVTAFDRSAGSSHAMGQPRQLVGLRADGSEFPMDASISRAGAGKRRLLTVMARDVSELRALEGAMVAHEAAESESRAKSALLSRVSHELRTPMNAVLGFAQLMQLNPSLDARAHEQLALIQRSGWSLVAMIDELLNLASVSSGEFSVRCVQTDLGEVAALALAIMRPQARERGVRINELQPTPGPVRAIVDPRRLEQILLNLLSNAVKYNRPGGWVDLRLSLEAGEAVATVEDNGLGMDDAQQSQLFQPFNRLGRELGPEEGTGMGLLLARELMSRMGGRMSVASQAGLGTQVRLHFRTGLALSVD